MIFGMDASPNTRPTLDPRDFLYHHDPETDAISFPPGYEDGYRWLRKTLKPFGVDIDAIKTERELDRVLDAHGNGIMSLIRARTLNNPSRSLEAQLAKATARGDYAESRRIRELLRQRRRVGLGVVPASPSPGNLQT
jgi:hypothetical protein